jgi:tetratricopeptide (TPR) repeat protein
LAAANRAIALAPELGIAHVARAYVLTDFFDFKGAAAEYSRALELAPGSAAVLMPYGELQMSLGQSARGLATARQAAALDALSSNTYTELAWMFWLARQYDDALAALRHAQQVAPAGSPQPAGEKGYIDLMKGEPAVAQRDCAGEGDVFQNMCLAMAYHALGRKADAIAQVDKVRAVAGDNAAYNYAQIYAQWGDFADALHWLATAYTLRDPGLKYIKADPTLDPIRGKPEFQDVVRRMNLQP